MRIPSIAAPANAFENFFVIELNLQDMMQPMSGKKILQTIKT